MRNKHGLSRSIPSNVALQVRRQSKFGCVICRCALYTYEHISPEFADAAEHNSRDICLLCARCHDRVNRGLLSKQNVRNAYELVQASGDIVRPYDKFCLASSSLTVAFGNSEFADTNCLIRVNGEKLLEISPPTDGAAFPTISGKFYDSDEREILRIDGNVWSSSIDVWDVTCEGQRISIRQARSDVTLQLRICPPQRLEIERLDLRYQGCHILCDRERLLVGVSSHGQELYFGVQGLRTGHAQFGIDVDTRRYGPPRFDGFSMIGGEGIVVNGTAIRFGFGGSALIQGISAFGGTTRLSLRI